jgi:hypothetical protein
VGLHQLDPGSILILIVVRFSHHLGSRAASVVCANRCWKRFDMDTKTILGLGVFVASFVVAPIVTAFVLRTGYRKELVDLMACGPSPSVPNAPDEQKGTIWLLLRKGLRNAQQTDCG